MKGKYKRFLALIILDLFNTCHSNALSCGSSVRHIKCSYLLIGKVNENVAPGFPSLLFLAQILPA